MYLLLNKNNTVHTGVKRWEAILFLENHYWKKIFQLPFLITKNTKLQWLQYRINHKILATNKFLTKIAKQNGKTHIVLFVRLNWNQLNTYCGTVIMYNNLLSKLKCSFSRMVLVYHLQKIFLVWKFITNVQR